MIYEKVILHDQIRFIPGIPVMSNIWKSHNIIHLINFKWEKPYDYLNISKKAFDKIQPLFKKFLVNQKYKVISLT